MPKSAATCLRGSPLANATRTFCAELRGRFRCREPLLGGRIPSQRSGAIPGQVPTGSRLSHTHLTPGDLRPEFPPVFRRDRLFFCPHAGLYSSLDFISNSWGVRDQRARGFCGGCSPPFRLLSFRVPSPLVRTWCHSKGIAEADVKAFREYILHGLARRDVVPDDLRFLTTSKHRHIGPRGAIVASNRSQSPTSGDYRFEFPHGGEPGK